MVVFITGLKPGVNDNPIAPETPAGARVPSDLKNSSTSVHRIQTADFYEETKVDETPENAAI